ncbi:hypothetical protein GM418_23160 [Maribellus comscasis]|jgi:hypothetical protein|uniref:Uncharacterized protein n=1 Tax=Maribellus comscasis TaxID=2681766 RepID=A0A6I6JTQ6_9BACT|nr:DUF6515 family protein [Maribellus comscasis]MDD4226149.1 DUF6515 family protein [Mariniphaga sp.]QGY46455.1 hypothetical protein GM418_23160 [Maribellus comscasis]
MKTKQLSIVLIMIFLIGSAYGSFAQRRVVNTPRRTVVQGPRGTVVYRKAPPVVKPVRRLPAKAAVVHYHSRPYYYHGGVFYVARNGSYVRVVPPVGIRVAVLPAGYVRLVVGPSVFFYAGGIFYVEDVSSGEYVVADPPVGAIVSQLPSGAAEVEIDGKLYYEYNGILYKPVRTEKKAYEVAGKLED